MRHFPIISLTIACVVAGCGTNGKLGNLTRSASTVTLALPYDDVSAAWGNGGVEKDTIEVRDTPEEEEVIIMNAVKDEEGEMVATDVISAAMVTNFNKLHIIVLYKSFIICIFINNNEVSK